jgi:hypothetical protein
LWILLFSIQYSTFSWPPFIINDWLAPQLNDTIYWEHIVSQSVTLSSLDLSHKFSNCGVTLPRQSTLALGQRNRTGYAVYWYE